MLKLKLPCFDHLIQRASSLERPWYWARLREEREVGTEDEMVGWHHRVNGHEFEQPLGIGDEQGSLACCSPWGHTKLDMTERLNWTEQAFHCSDFSCCGAWALSTQASVVVVLGLSCPLAACGIFLDQGLNMYPLHWHVDSYPLYHQGNLKHFCKSDSWFIQAFCYCWT